MYIHEAVRRDFRQGLNLILQEGLHILDFKDFGAGVILVQKPEHSTC